MTVEVLHPHGFCAGVSGALRKVDDVLAAGGRAYCLHHIVHNELVVRGLEKRGLAFVDSVEDVPNGSTLVFSAHGVGRDVRERAAAKNLKVVDATCPFVARVHREAMEFARRGLPVVVIGKRNHDEVVGILGDVEGALVYPELPDAHRIGVVSQTTMDSDEVGRIVGLLRERYEVDMMAEVCSATRERQDAVRAFSGDALVVLGSASSSNTARLCEVAGCRTFMAGTMDEVRSLDLSGIGRLGLTSGASTPEDFFREAYECLCSK